uniref:SET domain-containing protein 9 n=1 Tax=Davidia involucrata TaxID=16924 RepID=A0A5B7BCJ8_DAVIN
MAFLFHKFQEAVRTLAKSSTFARDPRHLQFEADINRLFLHTSYNRLGRNADEADAEEIIDMASKASFADQQKQVQENIHSQIKTFCTFMDDILLLDSKGINEPLKSAPQINSAPRRSGLSLAVGTNSSPNDHPAVPATIPLKRFELSQRLKDLIGYTLELKPSQIPHKEAGQGLFLDGEADVGSVIAFYPGVIYFPAYYRYIPGYPKVDAHNPYLITRYDGTVINAQPWGAGGETCDVWDWSSVPESRPHLQGADKGSDQIWKLLSKPLEGTRVGSTGDVLERRNPLAFAHFANHPAKGIVPNVMVCPYDFPLTEKDMRTYIPNILFGSGDGIKMKKLGSFWFKSGGSSDGGSAVPILKTLVLVATRALCDEEVLLNYRLSNSKRRPSWYTPVDEEEDRRRWS